MTQGSNKGPIHYSDVIMGAIVSQITGIPIVYWTVCSGPDQRKHQSSVSLAFVRGIHRWRVNSPHKWPVTLKMFSFDDVIMCYQSNNSSVSKRQRYTWCHTWIYSSTSSTATVQIIKLYMFQYWRLCVTLKDQGCFINVPKAVQNNLPKIYNTRNHLYNENFKLKLCTCVQSMALGTRTKFCMKYP